HVQLAFCESGMDFQAAERQRLTRCVFRDRFFFRAPAPEVVLRGGRHNLPLHREAFFLNEPDAFLHRGVGISLSILIDATLVRMILVPSLMKMMGNLNWWAPKFMRRDDFSH
ncbi:hypothetical protein, partial [Domibacillus antri]|uniref:hypothetical protein n=1 Tax=Domibacillus antri TaxID=1714264 RepID=UPI00117733D8